MEKKQRIRTHVSLILSRRVFSLQFFQRRSMYRNYRLCTRYRVTGVKRKRNEMLRMDTRFSENRDLRPVNFSRENFHRPIFV